jgi:hypothetical protein
MTHEGQQGEKHKERQLCIHKTTRPGNMPGGMETKTRHRTIRMINDPDDNKDK